MQLMQEQIFFVTSISRLYYIYVEWRSWQINEERSKLFFDGDDRIDLNLKRR